MATSINRRQRSTDTALVLGAPNLVRHTQEIGPAARHCQVPVILYSFGLDWTVSEPTNRHVIRLVNSQL